MSVRERVMYGATFGQRPWTQDDRDRLAELYLTVPRPAREIMAAAMDRLPAALQTEANRMGLTQPGAKVRKCMPCQKPFFSEGRGNWICPRCTDGIVKEVA